MFEFEGGHRLVQEGKASAPRASMASATALRFIAASARLQRTQMQDQRGCVSAGKESTSDLISKKTNLLAHYKQIGLVTDRELQGQPK